MDSRQLRYFAAIYEHGTLSRAAEHLRVAVSALSHHVANLETELGAQLFTRKPRGMEPTASGLQLYEHARTILATMDFALEDVRRGQTELAGSIAIGMPFSVIKVIGVEIMETVLTRHPKVRLLLNEGLSGVAFNSVLASETEFALVYNPPANELIEREPLLEEELFCIGRPSIIGHSSDPISFDELVDMPLILLQSGVLSRALMDRTGLLRKLEERASLQLASIAATLGALNAGLGCTLAPRVLVYELLESGQLNARLVVEPRALRTLYMVKMAGRKPTRLREAMMDLARQMVRQAVDDGRWHSATLVPTDISPSARRAAVPAISD